jgi:hypothetical protein
VPLYFHDKVIFMLFIVIFFGNFDRDLPSREEYYRTSTANYTIEDVLLILLIDI